MKYFIIIYLILIVCFSVTSSFIKNDNYTRPEEPKTTGEILSEIRNQMRFSDYIPYPIQAYIITSVDAHHTEFVSERDNRLKYVSEFSGSNGVAIITDDKAALWTDARYFIQAKRQVDTEYWMVMRKGMQDTPTVDEWLEINLPKNSKIGIDPFLISSTEYKKLSMKLEEKKLELISIETNLVDHIWNDRPELKLTEIFPMELKYTGQMSSHKVETLRNDIDKAGAESIIINDLDDIAWLLNLRASDIQNNPVFYAYVIITKDDISLFVHKNRMNKMRIIWHFYSEELGVSVKDYEQILRGVQDLVESTKGKILVSNDINAAIYNSIPEKRIIQTYSPVGLLKCIKNENEILGMKKAHIRDGAALVRYLYWLEKNVDYGNITEISGARKLEEFRSHNGYYMGESFPAISAFGENSAIIHYSPTPETDKLITRDNIYLIDSGGQYLDGTTDVTRTIHLGEPTDFQKMCFTRVLKGYLLLGSSIFPSKTPGSFFDALARKFLWDIGLDYGHGTGHGIGSFLGVHEYPPYFSSALTNTMLGASENMFSSNEPGVYREGEFGIRIEDIVQIISANDVPYDFSGRGALKFFTITLVPIQQKLIDTNLLTIDEKNILNEYHTKVRIIIGEYLKSRKFMDEYDWFIKQTKNISLH